MADNKDVPRWLDTAKLIQDKNRLRLHIDSGEKARIVEALLQPQSETSAFYEQVNDDLLTDEEHYTAYTVENAETGKNLRILNCGCTLPLDVDVDQWLEETKVEHLARHGIQYIELD